MTGLCRGEEEFEMARLSYARTREIISYHISNRKPCSVVRVGDGESVILEWPKTNVVGDLEAHLRLWFGRTNIERNVIEWLKRRLVSACKNASILGIPTRAQVKMHARYRSSYREVASLRKKRCGDHYGVCDAAVHRLLQLSGDLSAYLNEAEYLGIVTSKNVTGEVQEYFKPRVLTHYWIPGENSMSSDAEEADFCWLPNGYKEIRESIHVPYRGAVFLVGGGLMGKLLCEDIRKKGGIAIDIGSIFDGWTKVVTRDYFKRYPKDAYTLAGGMTKANASGAERLKRLGESLRDYERNPGSLKLVEDDI